MSNLEIYNKVRQVPKEARKEIIGGRLKGFTDINPMWRIKTLTETFGACGIGWYAEITNKRLETGANDEIAAFVDINLFVKDKDEWSKPIAGTGGAMFVTKEKNGLYTSDECFKMAYTDAISVAAKSLGIGADVYYEKDQMKYATKDQVTQTEEKRAFVKQEADNELSAINTIGELKAYWSKYKHWQQIPEFIDLKNNHKARIDETQTK